MRYLCIVALDDGLLGELRKVNLLIHKIQKLFSDLLLLNLTVFCNFVYPQSNQQLELGQYLLFTLINLVVSQVIFSKYCMYSLYLSSMLHRASRLCAIHFVPAAWCSFNSPSYFTFTFICLLKAHATLLVLEVFYLTFHKDDKDLSNTLKLVQNTFSMFLSVLTLGNV